MLSHLPELPDSPVARLFTTQHIEMAGADAVWFSLPGGQTLFHAGEPAEMLYIVRTGRLGAFRREEGASEPSFLGLIRPGEPVGEMALISNTRHTATVQALRDSEIIALPRRAFMRLTRADPQLMADLARLMVFRMRTGGRRSRTREASTFALMAATPQLQMRTLSEIIGAEIKSLGHSVICLDSHSAEQSAEWFTSIEASHDFVLYAAEYGEHKWISQSQRQVDRAMIFANSDDDNPARSPLDPITPMAQRGFVDMVMVHPERTRAPRRGAYWMEHTPATRLLHIRDGYRPDCARLARVMTGYSVGVVLSGGGARAYAHIGALRAFRESKVPFDFIGGTSMGAIIAASVAMGWGDEEIEDRIKMAFVDSSPVDDLTFPIIAMIKGEKVEARLAEHFGDVRIENLWRPYFCVSSNLTTGQAMIHQTGRLRHALRASLAIPGLLPPVIDGNNVLVDGAVLKNFPADVMRTQHTGPVVGVDVTRALGITPEELAGPRELIPWLMSGQAKKGPPIASILMRSATVGTRREVANRGENVDLLVLPDMHEVEIRDWKAFDRATEAGYRATVEALQSLECAVTHLRRQPSGGPQVLGL
jgi:NTE family protein